MIRKWIERKRTGPPGVSRERSVRLRQCMCDERHIMMQEEAFYTGVNASPRSIKGEKKENKYLKEVIPTQ